MAEVRNAYKIMIGKLQTIEHFRDLDEKVKVKMDLKDVRIMQKC
jgi:hypothetical protein